MGQPDIITQRYLRRWPNSKRAQSWAGRHVHIRTENGIWRHGGHGYTSDLSRAGIWTFEAAVEQVDHCGPEKHASFIDAGVAKPKGGRKAKAVTTAEAVAKPKGGRKAKAVTTADDFRAGIAQIEAGNHDHGRAPLVAAMHEAGAKIADKGDAVHVDWLGVKVQTTAGLTIALNTWCNKARRALMNGEVV